MISTSVVQVLSGKLDFQNVDQTVMSITKQAGTVSGESVHTILISVLSVISVDIGLNFI